eukprot:SAG11_NODE_10192_length_848_cov_1.383178_1_plen_87_part_00
MPAENKDLSYIQVPRQARLQARPRAFLLGLSSAVGLPGRNDHDGSYDTYTSIFINPGEACSDFGETQISSRRGTWVVLKYLGMKTA